MASRPTRLQEAVSISAVADYHVDAESSLRLYFTEANPGFVARFADYAPAEVQEELANRIDETDLRSALAIMSRIEALFRIDYQHRSKEKLPDGVSIAFRKLRKSYGAANWKVPLERKIFETWRTVYPDTSRLIGELTGAFRFRHWLAHGRYFQPQLGRKYDYQYLYWLATAVLEQLPLLPENA
jgi:hypothetical protein